MGRVKASFGLIILVLVKHTVSQGAVSQALKQRPLTTTSSIFASYSNSRGLIHGEVPKSGILLRHRAPDSFPGTQVGHKIKACPCLIQGGLPHARSRQHRLVLNCCLLLLAGCSRRVSRLRELGISTRSHRAAYTYKHLFS